MTQTNFIPEPPRQTPIIAQADVVVVGGGISGLSAAVSAAKNGAKVLMVERQDVLGGTVLGGSSVLNSFTNHYQKFPEAGKHQYVRGFGQELIDRMSAATGRAAKSGRLSGARGGGRMMSNSPMQNLEPKAPPPSFVAVEDDPKLPRVLLLGDSISMGYTLATRELLRGKANLHRPATNCGPTARGLELLDEWLGNRKWDVIHFNFGLHDLKYADEKGDLVSVEAGKQLGPVAVYEANLREIAARLQKTGARLIWASTTPVPEGANGRVAGSEAQYNAAAARVMEPSGILINDLHAVAGARRAEYQLPRDVHFTALGSQALAAAVAARVEAALGEATTPKD